MIALGNTKKMIMGGWVLAALLVFAYNGYQLTSLLAPPIAGYSPEVRSVIGKRHQLADQVAALRQAVKQVDPTWITAGVDRLPEKRQEEDAGALQPAEPPAHEKTAGNESEMRLPRLQGVLRVSTIGGKAKLRALLDGNIFSENDRIGNFMVQQISDKGVMLTNDDGSWFLQTPDVSFSHAREE